MKKEAESLLQSMFPLKMSRILMIIMIPFVFSSYQVKSINTLQYLLRKENMMGRSEENRK